MTRDVEEHDDEAAAVPNVLPAHQQIDSEGIPKLPAPAETDLAE